MTVGTLGDDDETQEIGPEPTDLETLLSQSDPVALHVRLSEDTEEMIGARSSNG